MLVTYDPDADATYVTLPDATVAKTSTLGDSIAVDLDDPSNPADVELLMAPGEATDRVLSALIDAYPALTTVRDALRRHALPAPAQPPARNL